ncbi:acyl carrier protein [Streptomyces lunalinharesii]|uniref:Carrier domain-containing protein n=1 Tax=Streptomyces lunalinharesii TaxID=333384 RepID=A0ABN3RMX7_9ACTN
MSAVYKHLTTLLTEKFKVPAQQIRPDATFADLGVDSLAIAELSLLLSERNGVEISDEDLKGSTTLAEAAHTIASRTIEPL